MKIPKPQFELARVYSDGTKEEVEIVPVTDIPFDTTTGRRGFLAVALTATAVLAATGCTERGRVASGVEEMPPKVEPPNALPAKAPVPPDPPIKELPPTDLVTEGPDCGKLHSHTDTVFSLVMSPDGLTLVSSSKDETIKLWNLPTGTLRQTLKGHTGGVLALAISPDGRTLASGSGDKTIRLWELPTGTLHQTLVGHTAGVRALAISPDGRTLVSSSYDETIKLWGLPTGTFQKTLKGHTSVVLALAISPDGRTLASASEEKTIRLWELPTGTLRQTLDGHTDGVRALAISPDGRTLVSSSYDKTIKFWDLPTGTPRQTPDGYIHDDNSTLAISPDGRTLVSSRYDKTIKLWDLPSGTLRQTLKGHTKFIDTLAISPDGRTLASGSDDKTIRLWELPSGQFKMCLPDFAAVPSDVKGMTYQQRDAYGQIITYTLPCGSPIPSGAICTCNCVPGTFVTPSPPSNSGSSGGGGFGGGTYCSCNLVCTCNKVCTCVPVCQAHRLQHKDGTVRTMAEEILFLMGPEQFEYMQWAAENSAPCLQTRISQVIAEIRNGATPDLARWPLPQVLESYLDHPDAVISLMAAQLLHHLTHHGWEFSSDLTGRVSHTLEAGRAMDWRLRVQ